MKKQQWREETNVKERDKSEKKKREKSEGQRMSGNKERKKR